MLTFTRNAFLPASLLAIALCAGCAHYTPKPLAPERSLAELEQRRLTDPAVLRVVHERAGASESWGRAQLLVAALELNPTVREARATLAQTQAGLRSARALQNPTISLANEYDVIRAEESPWLWGLATSVLIDSFASRGLRTDLAQASLRGAHADFEEALWIVRRDLRAALLANVISARRVTTLEQEERGRAEFLRLARARVTAGESPRAEVLQAELELARSTGALEDARSAVVDSRAKLAAVLGVPGTALTEIEPQFEALDAPMPVLADALGPLRERALLSRGDLARAIADYDARELDLRQQTSAQYLQASLGPGYTYDHGVRKLTLGASIALPIFNRNEGPIAEAVAAREAAGQHVLTVQAGILNDIDGARAAYSAALEALHRARAQRITSEAIAQSTRRALDVDAADRPTLLAAELSAGTERLAELDALDRAQQALGQLEDALRTPLAGPERDLRFLEVQP
jgi:outer membrane protein TolC